jgi:hypothetical protein
MSLVSTSSSVLLLSFLMVSIRAQDQTPALQPDQQQQQPDQPKGKENSADRDKNAGTSNDRLFFTLPNFLTLENAKDAPPLTAGQKFRVTARGTFDPIEFVWYGAQAGLSQADASDNKHYGQGAEGFGKRYATDFADGTIENFFTKAIFPSVLHEDPRYFQLGKGGVWHRTLYAIGRVFITRTDSGRTEFNFSEILGSGTAAAISNFAYHSEDDRNLAGVLDTWGTQVAFDALSYTIKEFWPDLRRKLKKSNSPASQDGDH